MNIEIQQAAAGSIDAELKNWPALKLALQAYGIYFEDNADPKEVRDMCRRIVEVSAKVAHWGLPDE